MIRVGSELGIAKIKIYPDTKYDWEQMNTTRYLFYENISIESVKKLLNNFKNITFLLNTIDNSGINEK